MTIGNQTPPLPTGISPEDYKDWWKWNAGQEAELSKYFGKIAAKGPFKRSTVGGISDEGTVGGLMW